MERSRLSVTDAAVPPPRQPTGSLIMTLAKKMIDRTARESLAEKLRQLASGAITNFAFEEYRHSRTDPAVHEIAECLAWPHYDDFSEHRLDGDHALTDGRRKDFARAVLFLKSDLDYCWPKRSGLVGWGGYFRRMFTFGLVKPKTIGGDVRFWPFWSEEDYRKALKRPNYLCGYEKEANQALEPTATAVTDRAAHAPRQP